MKKFISITVALLLFVSCFILGAMNDSSPKAGPGNGKPAKIETAEDLLPVIEFVAQKDFSSLSTVASQIPSATTLTAANASTSEVSDIGSLQLLSSNQEKTSASDVKKQNEHTSATVTVISTVSSHYQADSDLKSGLFSSSSTLNRTLKMYITENATYYESKGTLSSSASYRIPSEKKKSNTQYSDQYQYNNQSQNNSQSSNSYTTEYEDNFFIFDVEIVCYENTAYMYIRNFIYEDSDEFRAIKAENTNRWIEVPPEFAEELSEITLLNSEALYRLGEILHFLKEEGDLATEEKTLHFDTQKWKVLQERMGNAWDEENVIDSDIDCSNQTSPRLLLSMKNDNSTIMEEFIFNDIDNTVINFDKEDVEIFATTEKKFNNLFNLVERTEKDDD